MASLHEVIDPVPHRLGCRFGRWGLPVGDIELPGPVLRIKKLVSLFVSQIQRTDAKLVGGRFRFVVELRPIGWLFGLRFCQRDGPTGDTGGCSAMSGLVILRITVGEELLHDYLSWPLHHYCCNLFK